MSLFFLPFFLWILSSHQTGICQVDTGVPLPPQEKTEPGTAYLLPLPGLELTPVRGGLFTPLLAGP